MSPYGGESLALAECEGQRGWKRLAGVLRRERERLRLVRA